MVARAFIHGLHCLAKLPKSWVVTIGSFDGVHRGHLAVLDQVKSLSAEYELPSLVIIFEPQPYEFFSRESAPARLMRLREKVAALLQAGIDSVVCLKFNQALRSLTADEFIKQILVEGIGVKHLVVGDDFRFGCDRQGDFALLVKRGAEYDFSVRDTCTLSQQQERISSTRIRHLLENSQLEEASQLLGHHFRVCGKVIYGKQLGRSLGFPTANIGLGRYRSPVNGVYAVTVSIAKGVYRGVANVGVRPTVGGVKKPILEVHILDFNSAIYGQYVQVEFLHKLREEQRFCSLDELRKQIQIDLKNAISYFSSDIKSETQPS